MDVLKIDSIRICFERAIKMAVIERDPGQQTRDHLSLEGIKTRPDPQQHCALQYDQKQSTRRYCQCLDTDN